MNENKASVSLHLAHYFDDQNKKDKEKEDAFPFDGNCLKS